ncbi:YppG family protein [Virgibacillus sp. CBA3643]|uniref:YppG family protein n=1 Tax=Virgibacillus sp. CBA3643 TaxID=2942278 RepID=UPI0035A3B089
MPLFPQRPPQGPQGGPPPQPQRRAPGVPRVPGPSGDPTKSNLMAMFQTDDGKFDFDKITGTGKQVMDLYSQVSPMITKFFNR